MTKPGKAQQKAAPGESKEVSTTSLVGLPLAGERAATILGLKLTGLWARGSCTSLGAQWGITGEAVGQLAAQVDAVLEQLAGEGAHRRLVIHQLLLALSECDKINDPAKRVAARVKVAAELAKVTGLVKGIFGSSAAAAAGFTSEALK